MRFEISLDLIEKNADDTEKLIEMAAEVEEDKKYKRDDDYHPDEIEEDYEDANVEEFKLKKGKRETIKNSHQCPYEECGAILGKKLRLETHIRMKHTNYLPYRCPREGCSADFACQTYLNKHQARHDRPPKAKKSRPSQSSCSLCSQSFRSKHQLRAHQLSSHSTEIEVTAFVCDVCGARFALRSRLTSHKRRHRGYRCSYASCGFSVDKWSDLRKHLATEHRKLECSICRKRYSTSYNLRVHEETVHKERNGLEDTQNDKLAHFSCPHDDCDRVYVRESSLRTHQKTYHAAEPLFACPHSELCTRRFRHKKSLEHHLHVLDHSRPELFNATKQLSSKKKQQKGKPTLQETAISLKRKLKQMPPLIDRLALQEAGLVGGEEHKVEGEEDWEEEVEVDMDHLIQLEAAADAK